MPPDGAPSGRPTPRLEPPDVGARRLEHEGLGIAGPAGQVLDELQERPQVCGVSASRLSKPRRQACANHSPHLRRPTVRTKRLVACAQEKSAVLPGFGQIPTALVVEAQTGERRRLADECFAVREIALDPIRPAHAVELLNLVPGPLHQALGECAEVADGIGAGGGARRLD